MQYLIYITTHPEEETKQTKETKQQTDEQLQTHKSIVYH